MPNGKPGDHPVTDLIVHGAHPFPGDIEAMMRELHRIDPAALLEFGAEPLEWARRKHLDSARKKLSFHLVKHGRDPHLIVRRAMVLRSLTLIGATLLLTAAAATSYLLRENSPLFAPAPAYLKWTMPLGPAIIGIALVAKWLRTG
jgi:hypothetical protein